MTECEVTIIEDGFGIVPRNVGISGEKEEPVNIVRRYTITNSNGGSVRLISLGAGIQAIKMPDGTDVILGFQDLQGYLENRYIGRIINDGSSCEDERALPSLNDFDMINWQSCVVGTQVVMSCTRKLGKLSQSIHVQVAYSWSNDNELRVQIRETSTQPVPTILTLFCPMNLAGHGAGPEQLKNHIVMINCKRMGAPHNKLGGKSIDRDLADFRAPTKLKDRLALVPGGGYNLNLRINAPSEPSFIFCARIVHPATGRSMELHSNQAYLKFSTLTNFPDPGIIICPHDLEACGASADYFYKEYLQRSSYWKEKTEIRGKDGLLYKRNGGFVLSTQHLLTTYLSEQRIFNPTQGHTNELSYRFEKKS